MSKTKKSTKPKRINTISTGSSGSLSKTKRIYQKSKKKIINESNINNDTIDDTTDNDDRENDVSILSMLYDKLLSIFR